MKKLLFCIFNTCLLFFSYTSSAIIPLGKVFFEASYFENNSDQILSFGNREVSNEGLFVNEGSADRTIFIPSVPHWIENAGRSVRVGNNIFFASKKLDELWKTDGTNAGTVKIKDHLSGCDNLVNVKGILIFTQNTAEGKELWRSDGTYLGTQQVRNLKGSNDGIISALIKTNVNGKYLNFSKPTTKASNSDSTTTVTLMVKPIPLAPVISVNTCNDELLKIWDKSFGGNDRDVMMSMLPTSDGGYLLGGYSVSGISGDKSQASQGYYDFWVVKIDANGNKLWDKSFGGNSGDFLGSMLATSDGGYLLGGYSVSRISGDKSQALQGGLDYWVVKIDANGNKLWDKSFGGNKADFLSSMLATSDGGYLLGGYSDSDLSGNKSQASQGNNDYWVVKIDANGNKLWDKSFGGNFNDELRSILSTTDGGYLLGGYSDSDLSGNKSQASQGNNDYWVVKIDANGNKLWDKSFGGIYSDDLRSMLPTNDGGYLLGGSSNSDISGDKSQASQGGLDYWVVKIDANGNKLWDKRFGGNSSDLLNSMLLTNDGGYLLVGYSFSLISGDKSQASQGNNDYWVVKIDANGNKLWDKSFGGDNNDQISSMLSTSDGGYLLGGFSISDTSGDKSQASRGGYDYWVVKTTTLSLIISAANPSPICAGSSQVLTASGCGGSVIWNTGATGSVLTLSNVTATGTYTATCTNGTCSFSNTTTVTVNQNLTISVNNQTICSGSNTTLTASTCAGSVTWNTGATGSVLSLNNVTANGTYTATCTLGSCTASNTGSVTIAPKPTIAVNSQTICSGTNTTLTASTCAGSVTWNTGATGSVLSLNNVTSNGTYTATCTLGSCTASNTGTVNVTQNPTISVNSQTICSGSNTTLTASTCAGSVTWNTGATGSVLSLNNITSNGTYTATCTLGSCTASNTGTVNVTQNPTISVNNQTICSGSNTTLTASTCAGSVTWNTGATGSVLSLNNVTANGTYTATCTLGSCTASNTGSVTIAPKPTIAVNSQTICSGTNTTLTASTCAGSVTWNTGATGSVLSLNNVTSNGTYTATCTLGSCTASNTGTVNVTQNPTISVNSQTICSGSNTTLTASTCAGSVTWNTGATGSVLSLNNITSNGTYTATCTLGSCTASNTGTVNVTQNPTISVNNQTICSGSNTTLTASTCAGSVTWNTGATGSVLSLNNVTANGTYTATCTLGSCTASNTGMVTIAPKPTIAVNSQTICSGSNTTLTASTCAGSVTWNTGATGSVLSLNNVTSNGTYTATCTLGSCTASNTGSVNVTQNPTISVNSQTICSGSNTTLTASTCAGSVTWNTGATGSVLSLSNVTSNGTYMATCMLGSCTASNTGTVNVTQNPTILVNNQTICSGSNTTLTASTCSGSVTWNTGATGSVLSLSNVTSNGTYTATCTLGSCTASNTGTVTIAPKPTIAVNSQTICSGSNTTLTASTCAGSVTWNTGATGSVLNLSNVTSNVTYTATCTLGSCTASNTGTVTIAPKPTIAVNNQTICSGTNTTLTASTCAGSVTWNTGATGSVLSLSNVTANGTYTATCTLGSCTASNNGSVTIAPKPTIAVNSQTICSGSNTTLTASTCAGSVTWNTGATGSVLSLSNVTSNGTYTATCTLGSCTASNTGSVTVTQISTITVNNPTICSNNSTVLTASGCGGTYKWYASITGTARLVSTASYTTPTLSINTTYYVSCTENTCESVRSAVVVTVNTRPNAPTVATPTPICLGGSAILTATGCTGTLAWTGGLTGSSIVVSPTSSRSYRAACTGINTCTSDSSTTVTLTINPIPLAPVISGNTCNNELLKIWDKRFGGSNDDEFTSMLATTDGGYLLGGYSYSGISGDKSQASQGYGEYWVVRTDANGNKIWDKTFGGNDVDRLTSMIATTDGGYLLGGYSYSGISGDKSQASQGLGDFWVVKIDANGNKIWDKRFGGSNIEVLLSMYLTSDGGYLLGGYSDSGISGDKSQASQGGFDYWVVKIDANGNKIWDKRFGGNNADFLSSMLATSDGGYLLGGYSESGISGDKSQASQGLGDFWVVKIDANGNKIWDKRFGGNNVDILTSMIATTDGGYLLGGYSYSGISGDISQASQGISDYWIVKIDANGNKIWDKRFGGNSADELRSVLPTNDGGYLLGGNSTSNISGDKSQASQGQVDYWVVKIDANGDKIGDKTFGGNSTDELQSMLPTSDGGYLLGGISYSGISGDKSQASQGRSDYWVVKISFCQPNTILCAGQNHVLSSTGCAGIVNWSNGSSGNSITVNVNTTTTITATCTVNGCSSPNSNAIIISKPDAPLIATTSPSTICVGTSITLTASNCLNGTINWSSGASGTAITLTPISGTYNYTATCTQNGCSSGNSNSISFTVNSIPSSPILNSSKNTLCIGESAVLTACGCGGTVLWTNNDVAAGSGTSMTVTPAVGSYSFKATCTINGCTSSLSTGLNLIVNSLPTSPIISPANPSPICAGSSQVLTASGCTGSVTWNTGATGSILNLSNIIVTGTYTATCTRGSCSSSNSATITVIQNLTVLVNNQSICSGGNTTLTASTCAGSVTWNTGATGSVLSLTNVTTNGTYTATCTLGSCTASNSGTVTVTQNPTISVNNQSICSGGNTTLTASTCAGSVTWNTGATGSVLSLTNITATGTYTATCTLGSCTATNTGTINVNICPPNCVDLITLTHPIDDILSGSITKQASLSNGQITASNFITGIGTKATYQAKSIVLTPGFRADNGTIFKAEIGGCSN